MTPSSYDGESEVVMNTINRLSMPKNKNEIKRANFKALVEYYQNIDKYKKEAEYLEYVHENGTWGAEAVVYPGHNERW